MTHNCLSWSDYTTLYEHLFFFGVKKWFRTSLNQKFYRFGLPKSGSKPTNLRQHIKKIRVKRISTKRLSEYEKATKNEKKITNRSVSLSVNQVPPVRIDFKCCSEASLKHLDEQCIWVECLNDLPHQSQSRFCILSPSKSLYFMKYSNQLD